jgi:hypothetical protein
VASLDTPIPFTKALEDQYLPKDRFETDLLAQPFNKIKKILFNEQYFSYIIFSVNSHYENNIVSILLVILLISCHKKEEAPVPIDSNKNFDKYKEGFVLGLWELYPIGLPVKDIINWTVFW